jgi:hypothetical protein
MLAGHNARPLEASLRTIEIRRVQNCSALRWTQPLFRSDAIEATGCEVQISKKRRTHAGSSAAYCDLIAGQLR